MIDSKDRIISKANPKVKALGKIKDSPCAESFLIEGKHLCDMAYEQRCLLEVYSLEEAPYPDVKNVLVNRDVLTKIAYSPSPSGMVGVARYLPNKPRGEKILFLDRVQDPGNVGTLLRTALSFGYKEVILSQGSANPFSPKVIAASQGAIFSLNVSVTNDPLTTLAALKGKGYRIYGSALRNAVPLSSMGRGEKPFVLILGNEGQGVDAKLLEVCSRVIKIEMEGIESLNVGVAGGILMYRL